MLKKPRKEYVRRIETALEPLVAVSSFWREVICLAQVGSTNDVAKELAAQGAPQGTVLVADEQTAGRGRLNRRWNAPPGTSLLCSILFRPQLLPSQANRLTMLCSMAAADAVEQAAGLSARAKWPNDLIVESQVSNRGSHEWRKLAGILSETGLVGEELVFVVVGIGINVNILPETLPRLAPRATSILAETGRRIDRAQLLTMLLQGAETRYERLERGENPRQEWSSRLAWLGERVQVATSEGLLTGTAEAVDADGALRLRTDDGSVRRLLAGDVTLHGTQTASSALAPD
jgi:BirA family biotin operon repressor/biotin-[acetyl-CoA-carboxylase] ligase